MKPEEGEGETNKAQNEETKCGEAREQSGLLGNIVEKTTDCEQTRGEGGIKRHSHTQSACKKSDSFTFALYSPIVDLLPSS